MKVLVLTGSPRKHGNSNFFDCAIRKRRNGSWT